MDKMREQFVSDMQRMEQALQNTTSPYLKRDYTKALKRMKRELEEYDNFRREANG